MALSFKFMGGFTLKVVLFLCSFLFINGENSQCVTKTPEDSKVLHCGGCTMHGTWGSCVEVPLKTLLPGLFLNQSEARDKFNISDNLDLELKCENTNETDGEGKTVDTSTTETTCVDDPTKETFPNGTNCRYVWTDTSTSRKKRSTPTCENGGYKTDGSCCPTCKTALPLMCIKKGAREFYMVIHNTWDDNFQFTPVGNCVSKTSACNDRTCEEEKISHTVLVRAKSYTTLAACETDAINQFLWFKKLLTSFTFLAQTTFVSTDQDTYCETKLQKL